MRCADRVGDDLTLIGVGGITTPDDARERLEAGATLLQGYTAFIYEGPWWPRNDRARAWLKHSAIRAPFTSPARCWRRRRRVPTGT